VGRMTSWPRQSLAKAGGMSRDETHEGIGRRRNTHSEFESLLRLEILLTLTFLSEFAKHFLLDLKFSSLK
jgi:hypothetical protein